MTKKYPFLKGLASLCVLLTLFMPSLRAQNTVTISPGSNWTDVALYSLNSVNYSTYPHLNAHAWTNSGTNQFMRTLFRFNLGSIPAGASIQSATMYLYSDPSSSGALSNSQLSGTNAVYFEKVLADWNETTVIWNNQPASTTAGRVWQAPSTSTTENIQVNISSMVQEWVNNPAANFGLMMRLENEVYYRARNYASEDHTNTAIRPKLVITYAAAPVEPQEISTGFYDRMNYIFGLLEKDRVPKGLLLDFAFDFTNLDNYSGTFLADSNYVDPTAYWHIYQTLLTSRIHTNASAFASPDALDDTWFSQRQPGKITLAGLYYQYARFRDDAVDANRITISNERVVDKYMSGVWQNPYQTERVFAISPGTHSYEGRNQQILLPANLWKTNEGGSVTSLHLNAGDGQGYRTVTMGQPIYVTYPDTGRKVLTYKLALSNGSQLYSHSEIHIRPSLVPESAPNLRTGHTNPETLPAFTAAGTSAKVLVTIRYANNADRTLRNPLIVAEGYDPANILMPESRFGFTNLETFRDFVFNSGSFDLRNLLRDNPQFDIVYIDWLDGTDDIKKNAQLLKAVVRWVNLNKQPRADGTMAENVIIGQSMGGLVTRWGLKEMENAGELHQVRLFISHDVPYQGVNVPLGYQRFNNHVRQLYLKTGVSMEIAEVLVPIFFGGLSPSRALNLANRTASKQMLKNYLNSNNQIDNSVHDQWQAELRAMGYPNGDTGRPFRKVALSNGSDCASLQAVQPGGLLLSYHGKGNTRFLGDLAGTIAFPFAARTIGQPSFLLGILSGKNELVFNLHINAVANGGGNMVHFLKVTQKKKILWLIPAQSTLTDQRYNAPSGMLPFDSFSGGFYKVGLDLQSQSATNWFYKYNVSAFFEPNFNFVPTPSALDIGSGNIMLTSSDYLRQYVGENPPSGPKNSPFDNFSTTFVGDFTNRFHTSFDADNGNWVADELRNLNPVQVSCCPMGGIALNGPAVVCNPNGYYELSSLPAEATVTWGVTGNLVITASTRESVTVVGTTSAAGSGSVIANVANQCGQISQYVKNVMTGDQAAPVITGSNEACTGVMRTFYINPVPDATSYTWGLQPSPANVYWEGNGTESISLIVDEPGTYNVYVAVETPCGTVISSPHELVILDCNGDPWYAYGPNPVDDQLTVSYSEKATADRQQKKDPFEVKLYDSQSRLVSTAESEQERGKATLHTKGLRNGLYILHITNGKEIVRKHIVIQH